MLPGDRPLGVAESLRVQLASVVLSSYHEPCVKRRTKRRNADSPARQARRCRPSKSMLFGNVAAVCIFSPTQFQGSESKIDAGRFSLGSVPNMLGRPSRLKEATKSFASLTRESIGFSALPRVRDKGRACMRVTQVAASCSLNACMHARIV